MDTRCIQCVAYDTKGRQDATTLTAGGLLYDGVEQRLIRQGALRKSQAPSDTFGLLQTMGNAHPFSHCDRNQNA